MTERGKRGQRIASAPPSGGCSGDKVKCTPTHLMRSNVSSLPSPVALRFRRTQRKVGRMPGNLSMAVDNPSSPKA